jgi:hypothetical protein
LQIYHDNGVSSEMTAEIFIRFDLLCTSIFLTEVSQIDLRVFLRADIHNHHILFYKRKMALGLVLSDREDPD